MQNSRNIVEFATAPAAFSQYCCLLVKSIMPNLAFLLTKNIAILSCIAIYPLMRE
jgi:hypothetical protein